MIWPKIAGVSILLVCAAVPQDNLPKASSGLAPEVLLLSRIKRHLRDELAHIPNYTCLETVSRFRNDSKSPLQTHKGLERQDTIRLEIVFSDHSEWYGSPGARDLSANSPISFIGGGMIGNGAFAMTLNNIVEGGIFTYRGDVDLERQAAERRLFLAGLCAFPGKHRALIAVLGGRLAGGREALIAILEHGARELRM